MKTTKKTARDAAIRRALGGRNLERVSWKTLARICAEARPGSVIRKAIAAEARRCGYTLRTILALNHIDNALTDDSDCSPAGPM